jgi:hypothetical protein
LNKHKKTAKYCLEKQGRVLKNKEHECKYCERLFDRKDVLDRHYRTCKKKHDDHMMSNAINQVQKDQFEAQNSHLLTLITQLQQTIVGMQGNNAAGNTINRNNVVMNNLQPLTDEDIQEHLEHLTLNFIQAGAKGYADFAGNYPFKDRLVCTDKSRKKLKYKDSDGEVIEDGGGIKLAQRFFQAIAPRNEEIINAEYKSLHEEVQQIAQEGTAYRTDLTGILTKATHLQEILVKCQAAARGEENELTKEFVNHLTKML